MGSEHVNPISQSKKFDPQGDFIRHWLPELAHLSYKDIHQPKLQGGLFDATDYPEPMVDLASSRERALNAFKNLPRSADFNDPFGTD
ncbi:MAG: hypothetical protein GX782_11430 [Gammaproteobacteria bacterium]|nr:hypothetical protein [Gammaproteobacteria bacterium]